MKASRRTGIQRSGRPFDDVIFLCRQSLALKQVGNEGLGRNARRLKRVIRCAFGEWRLSIPSDP